MNQSKYVRVLGVVAGLLWLAGCGGKEQGNPLTVYTTVEDDEMPLYLKMWDEAYPDIPLRIVRDSTGIITSRLLAEKNNSVADVIWGLAASGVEMCAQEGMLEPYKPANFDDLRSNCVDTRNEPPQWVGIKLFMTGFACNTVEMEKAGLPMPASYADLTKPIYRGHVTAPNPASSGTGFMLVAGILQTLGEEEGWKLLDGLHENIAMYTHSGSKPAKLAGQGEFPIGISFDYRVTMQKLGGEPLRSIYPTEGSGYEIEANALIKKTEIHPHARTFLDWAVSTKMMEAYGTQYRLLASKTVESTLEDADYPADPFAQLMPKQDFAWMAANRVRILNEWTRRYDGKSEAR